MREAFPSSLKSKALCQNPCSEVKPEPLTLELVHAVSNETRAMLVSSLVLSRYSDPTGMRYRPIALHGYEEVGLCQQVFAGKLQPI